MTTSLRSFAQLQRRSAVAQGSVVLGAVVLAAVVVLVAVGAQADAAGPVVPWLDQHPAKAAANPPLAAPCRAAALGAHLFLQGATGSLVGGVTLRNLGAAPCALVGWPRVSFRGPAAAATKWQIKRLAVSPAPPDVLADPPSSLRALAPGKSASVSLWWSNWCGSGSTPTAATGASPRALELALASGTSISVPVAGAPRCDQPSQPSTLSVGPFTPTPRQLPARSKLPLRGAILAAHPVRVKPGVVQYGVYRGERFHFIVALTNIGPKPFRFARTSCPSYVEQVESARPEVYVLNCHPVAAIAPKATVRFAMQVTIPAHIHLGHSALTWELAPKTFEAPFAPTDLLIKASAAPPISFHWIQMLDSAHGYALSGENTDTYQLLWTSDGGRDWRDVTPGKGTWHPLGPLSVFGKTRLFSRKLGPYTFAVVRSIDGGRSWQQSRPFVDREGAPAAGQPFALDAKHLFLGVNEGAAAGSQGQALYRSNDGGEHWRFISRTSNTRSATALPFGCDKNGYAFATPTRAWAGGYCAGGGPFLYQSDDGGRSWQRQRLPVPQQCACDTSTPAVFSPSVAALYVIGFAASGGGAPVVRVLWTHDGGRDWRPANPPQLGRGEQVSFAGARSVWITIQKQTTPASPVQILLRTNDAGAHWQALRLTFNADDYRFDALSATTAFGMKVADFSNTLVVTHDGGRSWQTIHASVIG